jgi:hypothetical protein
MNSAAEQALAQHLTQKTAAIAQPPPDPPA